MSARLVTLSLGCLIGGAALAHAGQLRADEARRDLQLGQELLFAPRGDVLRVASLEFNVLAADVLWMRGVLEFGSRFGQEWDPQAGEWFVRTILAVTELDSRWRTPYLYGGLMLKVAGFTEASTEVFRRGAEAIPTDHYLPFAAGMNYYLSMNDTETAARWMEIASERPGAPDWYKVAVVAFRQKRYERRQVVHFLAEELDATTDPKLRAMLQERLNSAMHEDMAARFAELVGVYTERTGRSPTSAGELVEAGLLRELPDDPMGGQWTVDVDGSILSSVVVEQHIARDRRFERAMLSSQR